MRHSLLATALTLGLATAAPAQDGSKKSLEELFKAARAAQNAGKKADALKLADQAVKDYPKEAGAFALRGLIREEQDQLKEALADFSQVVKLEPDAAQFWNRRGGV